MRIHRLQPIPDTRAEFRRNELPVSQGDIKHLAETYGEHIAESSRFYVQVIRLQGGINPKAIECVFPEGRDGTMDEDQLFRILVNVAMWNEIGT